MSNTENMNSSVAGIDIKGVKCTNLPKGCLRFKRIYVALRVEESDVSKTNRSSRLRDVSWDESFHFDAHTSSILILQVYAHHRIGNDKLIGVVTEKVEVFLQGGDQQRISRNLLKLGANRLPRELSIKLPTVLEFDIALTRSSNAAERSMHDAMFLATSAHNAMRASPAPLGQVQEVVEASSRLVDETRLILDPWISLLDKIESLIGVVDKISEVHPYAKAAWSILSATYKVVQAQNTRDENIDHLIEVTNNVYSFVDQAEPLKKRAESQNQKHIVVAMVQQTTECAYFIRDYSTNKSFGKRLMKNTTSGIDSKIKQYEDKFIEIQNAFCDRAVLNIELAVFRSLDSVDGLADTFDLNDMQYAKGAGFNPEKCCLPGTRIDVIDDICDWVNSPTDEDTPRICVLSGMAGSGKSAIAHTVAHHFKKLKRLGSCYCFSRTEVTERHPGNFFSTIASDIADLDEQWKKSLCEVIRRERSTRTTKSVQTQFDAFILKPARAFATIGPILIVVDALDESGDEASREILIDILSNKTRHLPPNFRFLVTWRREPDIEEAFPAQPGLIKRLDTMDAKATGDDILRFIKSQLAKVPGLGDHRKKSYCRLLDSSGGLFQWAFTACSEIKHPKGGQSALERLNDFASGEARGLDELYWGILCRVFDRNDTTILARFQSVMGRVLVTREPLSMLSLSELRDKDESADLVQCVLRPLGSLLSGVVQDTAAVRPLHTSFRDFLTDERRSRTFYIDLVSQETRLGLACMRVMKLLRFNMCNFPDSHLPNDAVPDLANKVERYISLHLSYACRSWAYHFHENQHLPEAIVEIRDFFMSRFLYWLEALSLLRRVGVAVQMLPSIVAWMKAQEEDTQVATDASKFAASSAGVISYSAPHIYLSALPFAPKASAVSEIYSSHNPQTVLVQTGKLEHWSILQSVIAGHTNSISSVGFSCDSKRIVSGSYDQTIRVWDAGTGRALSEPLKGHTDLVRSVGFSPDGTRIVSGSDDKTIRVWDAETGKALCEPFRGHTNYVTSAGFSSDGARIVSGSYDETVRVWDAETGRALFKPFRGHTGQVRSVGFSPDGTRIVSGSDDRTIRVWNTEAGHTLSDPLEGHTADDDPSVGFSPYGGRIVPNIDDEAIGSRDKKPGNILHKALYGHTDNVTSVEFSSSGTFIVSGSYDRTIRIWNAETGKALSKPFKGHHGVVNSVGFSPDGRRIVSGSYDKTIRVWDVKTGKALSEPFEGHTYQVRSVGFSPDGTRIISGSDDNTIKIWDGTHCIVSGLYDRKMRAHNAKTDKDLSKRSKGHHGGAKSVGFSLHPTRSPTRIIPESYNRAIRDQKIDKDKVGSKLFEGRINGVTSVEFSPDGMRIISGSNDNTIRVWDAESGKALSEPFEGHTYQVLSVGLSPDGKRIVSGSDDETIMVWDTRTGKAMSEPFEGHTGAVNSVGFSPDGMCIVSGSDDDTIRVWDAETGKALSQPFEGHTDRVTSVGFSPDGMRIVSGSYDQTIRVWDTATGKALSGPFRGHRGGVCSVGFSPDGTRIVSGSSDKTIRVWDVKTGKALSEPFEGHTDLVRSVGFSPDCMCIVSGSDDQTIRIWDAETGKALSEVFKGHTDSVSSVKFSPDGKRIVSGSWDTTIRTWNAEHLAERNGSVIISPETFVSNSDNNERDISNWAGRQLSTEVVYKDSSALDQNGWILGDHGELLLWIPPAHRPNLWRPSNTCVIGENSTRLDFIRFVHGESWAQCREAVV